MNIRLRSIEFIVDEEKTPVETGRSKKRHDSLDRGCAVFCIGEAKAVSLYLLTLSDQYLFSLERKAVFADSFFLDSLR